MANEVGTLNGLFKDRYADKVQQLVPDHVKLYNAIKFDTSKKIGKSYNEPVVLSLESGFTYGGVSGNLFDLNDVKEFKMENAEIKARELVLRSAISIGALSRAGSDQQSIEKSMDLMVGNMLKSVYHRLEVQMFYGQTGIAILDANAGDGAATAVDIQITDAEWSAGIWNGTSGAEIEIFDAAVSVKRGATSYVVNGYSLANKTVNISRKDTGALASDEILADDIVFFKGAASVSAIKNEFLGVHGIATESVNLFGIANTNEPLFQGSIVDVGSIGTPVVLSLGKIEEGIAKMVEKGLMEEEVCAYVNPKQWTTLLTEQDAKRVYDSSYSPTKGEQGSKELLFHGQNGTIKVISSTFVKEGFSYLICEKDLKRIGSTEVTFKRPDGEDYLELLEGKHGVEMRCYTDQALFTARPASLCVLQYVKSEV